MDIKTKYEPGTRLFTVEDGEIKEYIITETNIKVTKSDNKMFSVIHTLVLSDDLKTMKAESDIHSFEANERDLSNYSEYADVAAEHWASKHVNILIQDFKRKGAE